MTEEHSLNLPASLERLKINPQRLEPCRQGKNPFRRRRGEDCGSLAANSDAECLAEAPGPWNCTGSHCQCSSMRQASKKPLLRRSRLGHPLRPPVLRLDSASPPFTAAPSVALPLHKDDGTTTLPSLAANVSEGKVLGVELDFADFKALAAKQCSSNSSSDVALSFLDQRCCSESTADVERPRKCRRSETVTAVSRRNQQPSVSSCSLQARMAASPLLPPPCDDTTIDELASYFDLFVHIPKKMSRMAEMMYT